MINNGSVQILLGTGTGLDENGDPIVAIDNWGESIPCQIETIKHDYKGIYQDGEFERASYRVYLEMQEFEGSRVRLTDNRNKNIGEFQIQDIQYLDIVQRIKITV